MSKNKNDTITASINLIKAKPNSQLKAEDICYPSDKLALGLEAPSPIQVDEAGDAYCPISILGHEWVVLFIDKNDDRLNPRNSKSDFYGICNGEERCIHVAADVKSSLLFNILAHELTHAYISASMHHGPDEQEYDEEFLANFVANFGDLIVEGAKFLADTYIKWRKN